MGRCSRCKTLKARLESNRRECSRAIARAREACEQARMSVIESQEMSMQRAEMRGIRRTAQAFLQGRFLILDEPPVPEYPHEHPISFSICHKEDVSDTRHALGDVAQQLGMHSDLIEDLLLGFGELATNVIQHAGSGYVRFYYGGEDIAIWVQDEGNGIPFAVLPERLFTPYNSGTESLGVGLTLLQRVIDGTKRLFTEPGRGTIWLCDQPLTPEIAIARREASILSRSN